MRIALTVALLLPVACIASTTSNGRPSAPADVSPAGTATVEVAGWRGRPDRMTVILPAGLTLTAFALMGAVIALARSRRRLLLHERALQASERRLKLALQVARMGYWHFNCRDFTVQWSGGHEKLYGMELNEFGGTLAAVQERVHPDDRAKGEANLRNTLETGAPFDNTYRVTLPDGSVRWLHSYGHLHRDSHGDPESIFGITQDISERLRADEAQRRQIRLQELLMSISSACINLPLERLDATIQTSMGELGGFVGADRLYLFDYDYRQQICTNTHEWCAAGIAPQIGNLGAVPLAMMTQWVETHQRGEVVYVPDVKALPETDSVRQILEPQDVKSLLAVPMMNGSLCDGFVGFDFVRSHHVYNEEEKRLLRVFAQMMMHVRSRRQAEMDRARLTTAIEQASEMVVITDPSGIIQYVNPAFERVTGYPRTEVMGRNPRLLKSGGQDEALYRELWETISSGRTWTGRFLNRRKNGLSYTEAATITPVRDDAGAIINYVAVKRDVTREMEIEQQLDQSRRMEIIGQLAGGVAHDFNNLLQAILGFTELVLATDSLDDECRKDLQEVEHAAQSGRALTQQLLAFSRRQILEPQTIDCNEAIEKISKMLRRTLGEHITLSLNMEPQLWPLYVDPSQLEQVILNLAVNARDAMPKGGRLSLSTTNYTHAEPHALPHADARPGRYVRLSVADTGTGMTEEIRRHIFEPFFTTKAEGKGTGLGLPTVYGIVRQHGGWMHIYTEPGIGSDFHVYLPVSNAAIPPPAPPQPPRHNWAGQGERILVVEDDESLRGLMMRILGQNGYDVLLAADAEEALCLFQREEGSIPLICTDVVLPRKSGFDLVEELKQSHPTLKAIFLSGYTDEQARWPQIREHGWRYLRKPVELPLLLRSLREVLAEPAPRESRL